MDHIRQLQQQIKRRATRVKRINSLRTKGKTDREIAEILGVSRARVQFLRKGKK